MSIDPLKLRAVSQLVLGQAIPAEDCVTLAEHLGATEEVLPWLFLRRCAFKDEPILEAAIKTAALKCQSPASRRDRTQPNSSIFATARELEEALTTLITEHISQSKLAMAADCQISSLTRLTAATERFDFQHRAVNNNINEI